MNFKYENAAEAFGLPYLPPYLAVAKGPPVRIRKGVNFAVAGATAINSSFFSAQNIVLWTNDSLNVQLGRFKNLKSSLCTTKRGKSLPFIVEGKG
ncbi:hypothetical protein NL676_012782 [Syzygium grande]|nr:hypothetical protein NL676_012782 [Syzygium grande]